MRKHRYKPDVWLTPGDVLVYRRKWIHGHFYPEPLTVIKCTLTPLSRDLDCKSFFLVVEFIDGEGNIHYDRVEADPRRANFNIILRGQEVTGK